MVVNPQLPTNEKLALNLTHTYCDAPKTLPCIISGQYMYYRYIWLQVMLPHMR